MARNFGNFISACEAAVEDTHIPKLFRTWSAVSAVAGALGRRSWFDFGPFLVRPNLYIVLIAGPGRGKSLSMILPFEKVFKGLTVEPGCKEGDEDFNYTLEKYDIKHRPLYIVQDKITPEKLSRVMAHTERLDSSLSTLEEEWNESSLTLVTSEFGSLVSRNDSYLQMFLTGMWDAPDNYTYRTKTSGEDILKGPCLNWIAASTPEQFALNLPENARTQGLLSRIIPVYYDGPRSVQSLWYGKPTYDSLEGLRADLADISKIYGEFRIDDRIRERAEKEVNEGLKPTPSDPNLSEYLERRPAHFIKVAMCMSAARSSDRIITNSDWEQTKELMFETEKHMPKALIHFGVGKAGRMVIDLYESLQYITATVGKNRIPLPYFRREIMRRVTTPAEAGQTLKAMEDAELIRVEDNMVIINAEKKKTPSAQQSDRAGVGGDDGPGTAASITKIRELTEAGIDV